MPHTVLSHRALTILNLIGADHFHLLLATALLETTFERRVVVVLDVVVCAARQVLGDFTPSVTVDSMELQDFDIFLTRPLDFSDSWVQMIVPPIHIKTIRYELF